MVYVLLWFNNNVNAGGIKGRFWAITNQEAFLVFSGTEGGGACMAEAQRFPTHSHLAQPFEFRYSWHVLESHLVLFRYTW